MKLVLKKHIVILMFFSAVILPKTQAQNSKIDSLKILLAQHINKDTIRVNLLNTIGYKLLSENIDKALQYIEEAQDISNKLDYTKGNANSLNLKGFYYKKQSKYSKALGYYEKALELKKELGDEKDVSKIYNNIGIVYKNLRNYNKSLEYYQKSLKIKIKLGDERGMTSSYNNIGVVYKNQNNYSKALEYYQRALKVNERLGNKSAILGNYINIGIIFNIQDDFLKTLEYYKKALKISKELDNKNAVSKCYLNIGVNYRAQGDYHNALQYFQKSLKLSKILKNKKTISKSYGHIGAVYRAQEDYSKALEYFHRSLKIIEEIDGKLGEGWINKELGELYFKQNEIKKSHQFSKKALLRAKEIGDLALIKESSKILAKSSESLGLYKEAYKYHIAFKVMSDSLFNKKNIRKITHLENQYQYEKEKQKIELEQQKKDTVALLEMKKQKKIHNSFIVCFIAILCLILITYYSYLQKRKANQILANQKLITEITNNKLEKSNAAKDKLFSIISHDLKNPFNIIVGFSNLLVENYKEFDEEQVKEYIGYINACSLKAYKLLENLLTWSQTQTGQIKYVPVRIYIKKELDEIILLLKESTEYKDIRISVNVKKNLLVTTDTNMLDIVLRNLISNAIKFTPKGGEITISTELITNKNNQKFIKYAIIDTGVGISKETQSKLFNIGENISTKGTQEETGTGLGLILCKEFVGKLGGEIWVESEIGKGSLFYFTIPL